MTTAVIRLLNHNRNSNSTCRKARLLSTTNRLNIRHHTNNRNSSMVAGRDSHNSNRVKVNLAAEEAAVTEVGDQSCSIRVHWLLV